MKKNKIFACAFALFLALSIFTGCGNNDMDNSNNNNSSNVVKDTADDIEAGFEDIKARVKTGISDFTKVDKTSIKKAVDYINKNIDKTDDETLDNLYYYGTYLEELDYDNDKISEHELNKLGDYTKDYVEDYKKEDKDYKENLSKAKNILKTVSKDTDAYSTKYYNLIKTNKDK